MAQEGRDVGRHKILAVADPHHQGAVLAHAYNLAGLAFVYRGYRIGALYLLNRTHDGFLERMPAGVLVYQVADYLCVGLRGERVPVGLQRLPELHVVFDYPVVN